jgi:hypothetical protein
MTPLSYSEWCATEDRNDDPVRQRERYETYRAGVIFIRSQIGGLLPASGNRSAAAEVPAFAVR